MDKNSNKHRNIIIVSTAILVFVLSLVGGALILLNQFNQFTPSQISLSFQSPQIYTLQGDSSQTQVEVNSIGKTENITLSSEANLSNITCTFRPAIGLTNFTSTLSVVVPDSIPLGSYTITVFASAGQQITNASLVLSVLNAEVVTVSGIASSSSLCNSSLTILIGIEFIDIQTSTETYVDLTGYYPFDINSPDYPFTLESYPSKYYSVKLMNGHTYNVAIIHYCGTQGNMSLVTESVGDFSVHVPSGETATHKDFP